MLIAFFCCLFFAVCVLTISVRKILKKPFCHSERSEESCKIDRHTVDGRQTLQAYKILHYVQNDKKTIFRTLLVRTQTTGFLKKSLL